MLLLYIWWLLTCVAHAACIKWSCCLILVPYAFLWSNEDHQELGLNFLARSALSKHIQFSLGELKS